MHPQVQWAKLEALAEGARLTSKPTFGPSRVDGLHNVYTAEWLVRIEFRLDARELCCLGVLFPSILIQPPFQRACSTASMPSLANFSASSGDLVAALIAADTLSTIAVGVPFGAKIPIDPGKSISSTPSSKNVGVFAIADERFVVATATTLTVPCCTKVGNWDRA